jgi:hypothetical protein
MTSISHPSFSNATTSATLSDAPTSSASGANKETTPPRSFERELKIAAARTREKTPGPQNSALEAFACAVVPIVLVLPAVSSWTPPAEPDSPSAPTKVDEKRDAAVDAAPLRGAAAGQSPPPETRTAATQSDAPRQDECRAVAAEAEEMPQAVAPGSSAAPGALTRPLGAALSSASPAPAGSPASPPPTAAASQPAALAVALDQAAALTAESRPTGSGPITLQLRDADGRPLVLQVNPRINKVQMIVKTENRALSEALRNQMPDVVRKLQEEGVDSKVAVFCRKPAPGDGNLPEAPRPESSSHGQTDSREQHQPQQEAPLARQARQGGGGEGGFSLQVS